MKHFKPVEKFKSPYMVNIITIHSVEKQIAVLKPAGMNGHNQHPLLKPGILAQGPISCCNRRYNNVCTADQRLIALHNFKTKIIVGCKTLNKTFNVILVLQKAHCKVLFRSLLKQA